MSDPYPDGLMEAFTEYERALNEDDLAAMGRLFAPGPQTLRGDRGGLLVGHDQIEDFRRVRGGAPVRELHEIHVQVLADDAAVITAVTVPRKGGHGLQTQVWQRQEGAWMVIAAQVSPVPVTFDPAVWRVVGSPLLPGATSGPLVGQTVAVKDLYAVKGFATGAGVPAYLAEQSPATDHAIAVERLLAAGAAVRGIAQTDQFAFSLAGDNPHSGTPLNAVVPAALPGGSSSGSATAVALGAATIGLGTDTGGSVRIPASYQGLWGLRTTHGTVPRDGMVGLAADFDTVGLLTRTPDVLQAATSALVGPGSSPLSGEVIELADTGFDLAVMAQAFVTHQGFQAWQLHGDWIQNHPDALRGTAAERFQIARNITEDDDTSALRVLDQARAEIETRLGTGILSLPAAASAAPRVWAGSAELQAIRVANLQLSCIAGISGRPALAVPATRTPDGPIGQCYVGPAGSDLALVTWAAATL